MAAELELAHVIKNKTEEARWVRNTLIAVTYLSIGIFLLFILAVIFYQAFEQGIEMFINTILDAETLSAIKLTLLSASVSVVVNSLFGVIAAWALTSYEFKGKSFLSTLLDLPFTISPVISGMMFVFLLGTNSFLGQIFESFGFNIIFNVPGIIIVTTFVTFPYIAKELIPHMNELGHEEEEAALLLGASGLKIFFKVTLPKIKWSLLYGVILCNARAIGEFGAVSVVSGHIRGFTNTMPLHIEILYNEYNFSGAFSVASLLTIFAVATLLLKKIAEHKFNTQRKISKIKSQE